MRRQPGSRGLSGNIIGAREEEYPSEEEPGEYGPGDGEGEQKREVPRAFLAYPTHNPLVEWEQDEAGLVTLIYKKNFGRFEKWLHSKIGGPENIRRPLDEPGSRIWLLSDGQHTILDICRILDQEFKEEMAPVFRKVRHFLEQLLILNLIILKSPDTAAEPDEKETDTEMDTDTDDEDTEPDGKDTDTDDKDTEGEGAGAGEEG